MSIDYTPQMSGIANAALYCEGVSIKLHHPPITVPAKAHRRWKTKNHSSAAAHRTSRKYVNESESQAGRGIMLTSLDECSPFR